VCKEHCTRAGEKAGDGGERKTFVFIVLLDFITAHFVSELQWPFKSCGCSFVPESQLIFNNL